MGKILIVEDNELTCAALISAAYRINPAIGLLITGYAREALDFAVKDEIIAFFLDIQLEDYSGLELAKQIREIKAYQFTPIIFITAMPTRELEAFRQIHCYDYILKPFSKEEIEIVFKKILIDYNLTYKLEDNQKLSLRFKSHVQLVEIGEILYIEYSNRRIFIHTKSEVIKYIHMPLKDMKKELPQSFIQIHQSIIINSKYLKKVDLSRQYLELERKDILLPIGRSYKKSVGDII